MKTTLLTLASIASLASAPAFADAGILKAQVFTSQSQLSIKGLGGSINREFDKDSQEGDKLNAVGGGAGFEFRLEDPLRVGTGLGFITYDGEDEQAGYSDFIWNVYGAFDFVNTDVTTLYGTGGLSFHRLTLEDFSYRGIEVDADSTDLLNYDLGVGTRFKLNYNTTFGLEYKYTQTFSRNDVDLKLKGAGLVYNGMKYEDVGIENNELQASLGFIF